MLYLEDYLEMIENLPMENRDRFTEMREMDLQVQNAMDSLEDRVLAFFTKCKTSTPPLKKEEKDEQFTKLRDDYSKALEDADEKVQLANQIHEMVERYLRKLDQELSKFKMELEADNAGITEILERRSLEMDSTPTPINNHRIESKKRKYSAVGNHIDKRTSTEKVLSTLANEAARDAISQHRNLGTPTPTTSSGGTSSSAHAGSSTPTISYSLGHIGAGSNAAIAAAASRAIGATLEMGTGRRTSSLKASYDAVARNADLSKLSYGASASVPSSSTPTPSEQTPKAGRTKKSGSRAQQAQQAAAPPPPPPVEEPAPVEDYTAIPAEENSVVNSWYTDPNEPRYCICDDVSYGEMVGCDNEDCTIEWFHYGCVGLAQAPKGKWFCPQCTAAMKRRGRK